MGEGEAVVRSYAAAFCAGDLDGVVSHFAPDAQIQGALGFGDLEFAIPVWRELIEGLGMQLMVEDVIENGSMVAARFRESGAFKGPFRGLAGHEPTGRPYDIVAMEWYEIADGKIARRWGARDMAAMKRQMVE